MRRIKFKANPNTTETDKAWAAGIVDGEGCILITRRYQAGTLYYALHIKVSQSSFSDTEVPSMLGKLKALWSSSTIRRNRDKRIGQGRLPEWLWEISTASAEAFLRDIRPYIVSKKDQVDVALESREKSVANTRWDNLKELQEGYFNKLRSLKVRMPNAATIQKGVVT